MLYHQLRQMHNKSRQVEFGLCWSKQICAWAWIKIIDFSARSDSRNLFVFKIENSRTDTIGLLTSYYQTVRRPSVQFKCTLRLKLSRLFENLDLVSIAVVNSMKFFLAGPCLTRGTPDHSAHVRLRLTTGRLHVKD